MADLRIELADPQGTILATIADPGFTRNSVALDYAWCIRQHGQVNFPTINRAILARWSPAGLEYIKKRAWKMFDEIER